MQEHAVFQALAAPVHASMSLFMSILERAWQNIRLKQAPSKVHAPALEKDAVQRLASPAESGASI
jgi:hypothetical protein